MALLAAGFYCASTLPLAGGVAAEPTAAAIVLTAAERRVFPAGRVFKGDRVTIDQLPPDLADAVIAIEDRSVLRAPRDRHPRHQGVPV